jgi:hypothetical protein
MKARAHLLISFFIVFCIVTAIIFYDKDSYITSYLTEQLGEQLILIMLITGGLFILGAIFPDIDSEDDGSYIFHQPSLKPLAKLVKSIFQITGKLNHKGFLHTMLGIWLTSIVVVAIISIAYSLLINKLLLQAPIFWLVSIFLGQLSHLVEDLIVEIRKGSSWKIRWM